MAGAAGALSRYGLAAWIGPRSFPWATLGVNLAGSFALGLVLRLAVLRHWPDSATVPVAIGFLGAFTTFSTFSGEAFTLLRTDRAGAALAYVSASVVAGVLVAGAGYSIAKQLA